jgi:hypothetical protein
MFEAKLSEGVILKKIVDSIKDIVTDVNIDISPSGKYKIYSIYPHNQMRKKMRKRTIMTSISQ